MSKDTGGPATAHEAFARALDEAAKVCDKRAERRWEEHGYTEPDTNASYYPRCNEWMETADEEAEEIAAAIRAIPNPYPAPTPPEENP